jgi:hypothetical protein
MINRAKMPRQLRNKGGIMTIGGGGYTGIPMGSRTGFGIISKIKDRIRKLIPNELASVAVKAAPFVAPFNPAIAGLMRGIGRFDQRGSLSDAFKQGLATTAFGAGARTLGGATDIMGGGVKGGLTSPLSPDRTTAVKDFFTPGKEKDTDFIKEITGDTKKNVGLKSVKDATGLFKNVPILKNLPSLVQQQILVGGVSGALTYIYQAFLAEEPPQQEGETYEEYMARRKENVGKKMKGYFDNYFKFDKEYSSMTDVQKQAFIDRVNVRDGGRIGYQTGGITMANTLAENIKRNLANQAAINQKLEQARTKLPTGITRTKSGYTTNKPAIDPTGMLPQTSTLNPDLEQAIKNARAAGRNKEYIDTMLRERQDDQAIDFFKNLQPTPTRAPAPAPAPTTASKKDMTDPMLVGFDYSKPINWSPGQPAPEGYRVVNMMGDEFLEKKFPSKEEIARLPTNYLDDFPQLPGPMGSGPIAPMVAPFEKYGITPDQYANMSPEDQEAVMNRVDRDMGIYGDNIGKRIYGIPDDEADDYGITFAKGGRVNFDEGGTGFMKWLKANYGIDLAVQDISIKDYMKYSQEFNNENPDPNETGRKKNAMGSMPVGIMRTNKAGVMERDYRDKGGFVPVGIKEKADDVPAMLSKNEFVFTADAVRGAGNGSIEKGAQRMYDTMKKLEKRVV